MKSEVLRSLSNIDFNLLWSARLPSILLLVYLVVQTGVVCAESPESAEQPPAVTEPEPGASAESAANANATETEEAAKPEQSTVEVQITGAEAPLEEPLLKNAQAYVELYAKREQVSLTPVWIRHLHEQAGEEIQKSLEPFGYYNVQVKSSLQQNEKGTWIASYVVNPGPQAKLGAVDVQWQGDGSEEPELLKMVTDFPLKAGEVVQHSAYDKAKAGLLEKASSLGYVDVETVVSKLIVYPKKNSAEIKLHLQTGSKYYIGEIILHQDVLQPDFVIRYLDDVETGDTYSQEKMLEIQRDFIEAGYYSLIDVKPAFDEAVDNKVPVHVKLEPANRQKYSFGLGYDTDIGLNINARWQHRRWNSMGHHADAMIKLSQKENRFQVGYWVPVKNPKTHKLGYIAKFEQEILEYTERKTFDLEAGYYYKWDKWVAKAFVEYKHEGFIASLEDEEVIDIISVGIQLERTAFEKAVYSRRGWALYSELRGSPGLVFEDSTSYLRLHVKSMLHLPVFEKGRLILRGEIGTAKVDDFRLYPLSLRFFAGGDNSVRGYEWKSLGPVNEYGEVIGGTHVVTGTLEYNHQVAESWLAAAFVDTGNAFDNTWDKTYTGAGFGGRWLSPVGIVRADLAWPLDDDDGETEIGDVRLHIGFEVSL